MGIDEETKIIKAYVDGQSMGSLAREHHTYPMTIKRLLEKAGVELRHDETKKGEPYVKNGEELIEWAKAQGRLVTKAELAKHLGKVKISPSYFIKYPELGHYVTARKNKYVKDYTDMLYKWLQENDIPYKPGDRTVLDVVIDAILLGKYTGIAIQVAEKPYGTSTKVYNDREALKVARAKEKGLKLITLNKKSFTDLDALKTKIDSLMK